MGLKSRKGLESFCAELSSDRPSPGGGSASAASGAMAASLLEMVCGITRAKKSYEKHWKELDEVSGRMALKRAELVSLAEEDAEAYDKVVEAMRGRREKDTAGRRKAVELSLIAAAEVPIRTAGACVEVLDAALRLAEIGTRSAASDVGVAVLLAHAGLRGATMNVAINLQGISERSFAERAKGEVDRANRDADEIVRNALGKLEKSIG
ncbi:MAG: hypothetical protein A3K67_07005 [Euryarchaeota archaeon RBG_16_62_10]|nr:MAG: hypothetical protein A3K67_07005 [Euryarchaeota archaeon RBG_16_62_10]